VFCSEEVAEAVHPLQPLQRRLYSCGRHFETAVLREQIEVGKAPAYGIIVIDGSDAIIGTAQGVGMATCRSTVSKLAHVQSNTASSTRRGGQSALRFSRLRDADDLAFCRRIAEKADKLLAGVRSLVLAGKADTKRRLLAELPQPLQNKVLCLVDLSRSADVEALREAALRAGGAADADRRSSAEHSVQAFLEIVAKPDAETGVLCCYGEQQTAAALAMGAIEVLLVAADCESRGGRTLEQWQALAEAHGTSMLQVEERSEQSTHFCQAFGMGGCLRWPVDPELFEEREAEATSGTSDAANKIPRAAPAEPQLAERESSPEASTEGTASTVIDLAKPACPSEPSSQTEDAEDPLAPMPVASTAVGEVFSWVGGALQRALGDDAAAEALTACVEVILADESTDRSEAVSQAALMLLAEGVPQDVVDEMVARAQ